jgi:hypothetical protein
LTQDDPELAEEAEQEIVKLLKLHYTHLEIAGFFATSLKKVSAIAQKYGLDDNLRA